MANVVVETDKALAYNNAEKLAVAADGKLHLAYTSNGNVYYICTADKGGTWSDPYVIGLGAYPALCVNSKGSPSIAWQQQWTNTDGGGIFYRAFVDSGWGAIDTLCFDHGVAWDYFEGFSPPSMTIKHDTAALVYEKAASGGIPPKVLTTWALNYVRFPLNNSSNKTTTLIDSYTYTPIPPWENPASAAIATDLKGNDHIAWDFQGRLYYRMRYQSGLLGDKVGISTGIMPRPNAISPSIYADGAASIVWAQTPPDAPYIPENPTPRDIYQISGYDQKWGAMTNLSNNLHAASSTVCGTEVLWTDDQAGDMAIRKTGFNAAKMAYAEPECISTIVLASSFAHGAKEPTASGVNIYRVWVEQNDNGYGIVFNSESAPPQPIYALDAGLETPSIYTVDRDGYIDYNAPGKGGKEGYEPYKTVDYDSTALVYRFAAFDPNADYELQVSFYQETGQEIRVKPKANQVSLGEVKLPSGQLVVLEKRLPDACLHDSLVTLTLERKKGPIAVCGKILIYQAYKSQGNKSGGAQLTEEGGKPLTYIYALNQNAPNPFNCQARISYQLAQPGNVSLKIYNTLGQLVNTLVNGHQQPGIYSANWNGKDNSGRTAANGVYFYRIESGDFKATKKMVVIR